VKRTDLFTARNAKRAFLLAFLLTALTAIASMAIAQSPDPAAPPAKIDTGDTAWMLVSSAFVLLMTPGLALFYGGMVRAKNVLNMLMQSFVAMSIVTVLWVVVGYSIAFATGNPFFGGFEFVGLAEVGQGINPGYTEYGATIPLQVHMLFQLMFAIITPALISGAIAERMKFSTYCVFIALWSLVVYCPLAHMVWAKGGYLGTFGGVGALDFAGGTVVHMSSGFSALVLCIILGKRKTAHTDDLRPHNLPMTLIGTGLLWFGWFGFNAGSGIASNGLAASAFMVTHVAAATAGLVWVLIEWVTFKKPTALGFATGAVAGLVAITPASGFVSVTSALIIGAVVSFVCFGAIKLKSKFGYDDTLDVFGVHGVGGTWGAIATGLFCSKAVNSAGADGLFTHGGGAQLGKQLIAAGVAIAYAVVATAIIALILKAVMGLRVSNDGEDAGLDLAELGESAYASGSASAEQVTAPTVAHGVGSVPATADAVTS
jgi:Amt family ammonium transporter